MDPVFRGRKDIVLVQPDSVGKNVFYISAMLWGGPCSLRERGTLDKRRGSPRRNWNGRGRKSRFLGVLGYPEPYGVHLKIRIVPIPIRYP
jgi:hypothetical protein